jgi:hypothetical protein
VTRTRVFVSYSREDHEWLNRFLVHVAVLERHGLVEVWSDRRVGVGADWEKEIDAALAAAKVAVLLVSPSFLASEYIWKHEMPLIIAHSEQGMDILPLIVRPCAWRLEEALARLEARPSAGRPLSQGSESQIDHDLSEFAYELAALVGKSPAAIGLPDAESARRSSEEKIVTLAGNWTGHYNRTRPIQLLIREVSGNQFRGKLLYPDEGTVTTVEGTVHERWSPTDPSWAQLGGGGHESQVVALSFRETGYETKGSSSISFDGEYRVLVRGNNLTGAWFSGTRLVGLLALQHSKEVPRNPGRTKGAANPAARAGG